MITAIQQQDAGTGLLTVTTTMLVLKILAILRLDVFLLIFLHNVKLVANVKLTLVIHHMDVLLHLLFVLLIPVIETPVTLIPVVPKLPYLAMMAMPVQKILAILRLDVIMFLWIVTTETHVLMILAIVQPDVFILFTTVTMMMNVLLRPVMMS